MAKEKYERTKPHVNMTVELGDSVALEKGSNFAIREGGLTVGAGVITEIVD